MLPALLSFVLSFGITFLSIPAIITIAILKKLYDVPDSRKIHITPTASLGGVGIFVGFILALLVSLNFSNAAPFQFYIASAIVVFFLGLKDDILIISPIKKFIGELIAVWLIVYNGGLRIENMNGIFGVNDLNPISSIILTVFTILVIINAFNLIDGIDGLAGSLGLMVTSCLGLYFLKVHLSTYAILSFSLAGSLVAFLFFNFQPAKIFMGDTGSLLIGLISSILVINFINISPHNLIFPVTASPAIGFSLLAIPLLDTLRVFSIRISKGHSPFAADKNHIHHLLLDLGLSHKRITLSLILFNATIIIFGYLARDLGNTWIIVLITSLFFLVINCISYLRKKKLNFETKLLFKEGKESFVLIEHTNMFQLNESKILSEEHIT